MDFSRENAFYSSSAVYRLLGDPVPVEGETGKEKGTLEIHVPP